MKITNTKTGSQVVKRLAWSCVLASGLLAGTVSPAIAHETRYDRSPRYEHFYVVDRAPAYPRWLRKHKTFKRWYVHSRYYRQARRHHRHVSWNRLYEVYLNERLAAVRHRNQRRYNHHSHYEDRAYEVRDRGDARSRRRHDSD